MKTKTMGVKQPKVKRKLLQETKGWQNGKRKVVRVFSSNFDERSFIGCVQ